MNLKFLRKCFWPAAALPAVLALAGCDMPWSKKEAKSADAGKKPPVRLFPVKVQTASIQPLKYELQALGTIEAQDVYQIHALVPGTLYDVNFNEGDKVEKDQVLCKIAPDAYRFMATKAEGIYKNAAASLEDMKRKMTNEIQRSKVKLSEASLEIARRKDVKEAGAISTEEIQLYESRRDLAAIDQKDMAEAAVTELKVIEATILEKDAAWKIALDDVRKSIVKPPIGGMIEKRSVTSGMFVQSGTLLATIVDRTTLKLKFKLAEKDSAVVRSGMKVNFTVPAWPARDFEAEIYFISNQLDRETRTVDCFARVAKDDAEKLKPGYFASARMVTGGSERAVIVPSTAVLPTEKGFVAFVIKDGKAEQRFVKMGMAVTDNSLEVLAGIAANEEVVIDGANSLQNGSPVRIVNKGMSVAEPDKTPKKSDGAEAALNAKPANPPVKTAE